MYYPKSEITENLYTGGGEFAYKFNSVPYVGYYYSTIDGKFFTGKTFTLSSQELVKLANEAKLNSSKNYGSSLETPTDNDYALGYFTRYVAKRVNGGFDTIKEISKEEYESLKTNPLYIISDVKWSISGPLLDLYSDNNTQLILQGAATKNKLTVSKLEIKIPGITQFFKNFAQYHK